MPSPSRDKKSEQRRAKAEALRKQQEAVERRRLFAIVGGAVATAAIVVIIIVSAVHAPASGKADQAASQIVPAAVTGTTTKQATVERVADDSGISGVLAWNTVGYPSAGTATSGTLEHEHVAGPVAYSITPPVGGPHNAIWMNAGVYTKPVPTERAVHNLEHGAVWITYRPDLPAATVKALTAFVTKQTLISETVQGVSKASNRYVDLSPWSSSDLPAPIVISSWGHQLRVSTASDPRLQQFVDAFRHSKTYTPEYGAAVDGVPVQTGGRAAVDGGSQANPAGSAE